jgi:hypothetical protein
MSEQRRDDDLRDARVSETYRELSSEQTSAALDRKVVGLAEAGAPSKSLTRLLSIKPLAWAATVVLTVSLVLHLQQTPTPDTLLLDEDVMSDAVLPAAEPQPAIQHETMPVVSPARTGRQDDAAVDSAAAPKNAARDADSIAGAEPQSFAPAAETRAKMQEAEEFVAERERSISSFAYAAETTLSVQGRRSLAAPEPRYCSAAETADASSWYRCILALEEDGRLEEAAAERTRLFSAHPDFEVR